MLSYFRFAKRQDPSKLIFLKKYWLQIVQDETDRQALASACQRSAAILMFYNLNLGLIQSKPVLHSRISGKYVPANGLLIITGVIFGSFGIKPVIYFSHIYKGKELISCCVFYVGYPPLWEQRVEQVNPILKNKLLFS